MHHNEEKLPKGIRTAFIYFSKYDKNEVFISFKQEEPNTHSYQVLVAQIDIDLDNFSFPNKEEWAALKYTHSLSCAEARIDAAIKERIRADDHLKDLMALPAPTIKEE